MKEGIGGTSIFLIVIVLILLFAGIMSFTINHSNAFAVKDELISIIESNGGFDMDASNPSKYEPLNDIKESLQEKAYRQSGDCEDIYTSNFCDSETGECKANVKYKGYQRNGELVVPNENAAFCIFRIQASYTGETGVMNSYYYRVYVFYALDLPIINELFNFSAMGETKILYE